MAGPIFLSLSLLSLACSRNAENAPSTSRASVSEGVAGVPGSLVFTGACDASGAVPLTDTLFAVGDDEDNVLRVYDATRGGAPIFSVDVSSRLDLDTGKKKKKKSPETDIEGATRVGDLAFWITSHGRNSSGKLKPERFRFFATTAPRQGSELEVVGTPYERLLDDLLADPRFAAFDLASAAERAPKDEGGLSIEGLTHRVGGGVFIGFRNPTPNGKALLFALFNPEEVVQGGAPRFGDPLLIDLGGLGIRSLSWWRGRYLVVAGHFSDGAPSLLYSWDGEHAPERIRSFELRHFNPEGFFTPEGRDEILLLSDDGSVVIDGRECKKLKNPTAKRFRGLWVTMPAPKASG